MTILSKVTRNFALFGESHNMRSSIVHNNVESRKTKTYRSQRNTLASTMKGSLLSMDHSEPQCEIRLNRETCEKPSIERTRQHPSVQQMEKSDTLLKDRSQNQYSYTEYWFDRNRCLSRKNENESKFTSQPMIDCNSDFAEEWKTKNLEGVCDEADKVPRNYNEPHQSTGSYIELEESSSSAIKRLENEISSRGIIDLVEMGDDFSFSFDLESDSEIQVAVNEIRKEAEKIDTILVLDQFKTLQTEFESMQNKYSMKTIENEDLKLKLQDSENRVAHMELERDLHHADAEKLREDLKTVVSKMFDISMYESSDQVDENIVSIKETANTCQSHERPGYLMTSIDPSKEGTYSKELVTGNRGIERYETNATSSRRENIRILGLVDQPRHVTRRLRRLSDPLVYSERNAHGSTSSETDTTCLLPPSPENKPLRNQKIFRTGHNCVQSRIRMESSRTKQQRNLPLYSDSMVGEKIERTTIYRHKSLSHVDTHSTSLVTEMYDAEEETEKRRCGKLFRRRRKQRLFSKQDVSFLKQQIYQLNERMKTSTATSEKLRKRLNTLREHYEGVISKLQTKLEEAREEKAKAQSDLASLAPQIDIERKMEQSKFEYELRRKNKQIRRLKAMMDQGEI